MLSTLKEARPLLGVVRSADFWLISGLGWILDCVGGG